MMKQEIVDYQKLPYLRYGKKKKDHIEIGLVTKIYVVQ